MSANRNSVRKTNQKAPKKNSTSKLTKDGFPLISAKLIVDIAHDLDDNIIIPMSVAKEGTILIRSFLEIFQEKAKRLVERNGLHTIDERVAKRILTSQGLIHTEPKKQVNTISNYLIKKYLKALSAREVPAVQYRISSQALSLIGKHAERFVATELWGANQSAKLRGHKRISVSDEQLFGIFGESFLTNRDPEDTDLYDSFKKTLNSKKPRKSSSRKPSKKSVVESDSEMEKSPSKSKPRAKKTLPPPRTQPLRRTKTPNRGKN